MTTPNIRYYARLEDCTGNGKTPKYVITARLDITRQWMRL